MINFIFDRTSVKGSYMRLVSALSVALIFFSGCAHEMSLEEAKKVSLSLTDSSFVAPPRTIDDILKSI